ncbi:hypothetical protein NG799_03245 [Laspinema sp. D1]|uniref:Uncharacterized protein n=1 Tax=Laspinema palackyanum D2a TaxID=2953684 RepID=A0ABT2MKV2_9CYAN|nr:hypothetical protein [Laspinema sp. D2b]MCT7965348.1 hypothetical protein [Laspinema sp. D2a]
MYLDYLWKTLTQSGSDRGRFKPLGLPMLLAIVTLTTVSCTTSPQSPPSPPSTQSPQSPVVNPNSPPIQDDRGSDTPDEIPTASSIFPKNNAQGDYTGKSDHIYWQVVDPDPNGLNCRMGDRTIDQVWNPSAGALDIGTWSVTGTLPPDSTFQAALSPGGFVLTFDANNQPWMFVESSNGPEQTSNCFIRANSKYITPIIPPR